MPSAAVVVVPHGAPAREALWGVIAAEQADDPLAPVTVAVPSPYAGLSLRRELGTRSGLVNVRFMALARVAELLGAPALAADQRRPLTPAVRGEAVHAALVADAGPFSEVLDHPSTAARLAATFLDLRRAGDGADRAALATLGPRAAAVGRLYDDFLLRTADFYDEEDLLRAAAAAVDAGGRVADEVGQVVVWLPTGLTPAEERFVRALRDAGRATVVLGTIGDPDVDGVQAGALATRLGAVVDPADSAPDEAARTQLVCTPDPEDEVRSVARRIIERAEAGTPLHEMAVLYRLDDPYARVVPEILVGAGIAWNGPSPRRLSDSIVARVLLGALELAEHDLARDEVAAWLSSGPVRDPADGHAVPATRWDLVSREAGIVSHASQWHDRLDRLHAELTREVEGAGIEGEIPEWRMSALARDLETVEKLAAFVADLARTLAPPAARTWSAHVDWARGIVERYLGSEAKRGAWPDDELDAGRRLDSMLLGLATLDELGAGVDTARFRRALGLELDVPFGRVEQFGRGIFVGGLRHAYGAHFDTVFVLGMVEGAFPPRGREDPILPDRERSVVGGALALHADRRAEERRDYLAALAAASDRVLCFPRADPRAQRKRLPARWLVEAARSLHGADLTAEGLRDLGRRDWLEVVESFEDGVRHDRAPCSTTEYDMRSLADWRESGRSLRDHFLAPGVLGAGFDAISERASSRLTAHDGFVGAGLDLAPSAERPVAPTSLQEWAYCPFRYYLSRVLRVREVPKPETTETISALDEGTLVHAILEEFVTKARPRTAPGERWGDDDIALLESIVERRCDEAEQRGLTGRRLHWVLERRRIVRMTRNFLHHDEWVRAQHGSLPVAGGLELGFGFDGEPGVGLELHDGRAVTFRGRIDRVDRVVGEDRVVVFDYKTGRPREEPDDPVDAGRRLQLPVYALAAAAREGVDDAAAYYWYTRAGGDENPLEGHALDTEVRDRFVDVVGTIVDGIDQGSFPAYPGNRDFDFRVRRETFANCLFCPYDRVCAPDRLGAWDRKSADPAAQVFRSLELPDEDDA